MRAARTQSYKDLDTILFRKLVIAVAQSFASVRLGFAGYKSAGYNFSDIGAGEYRKGRRGTPTCPPSGGLLLFYRGEMVPSGRYVAVCASLGCRPDFGERAPPRRRQEYCRPCPSRLGTCFHLSTTPLVLGVIEEASSTPTPRSLPTSPRGPTPAVIRPASQPPRDGTPSPALGAFLLTNMPNSTDGV